MTAKQKPFNTINSFAGMPAKQKPFNKINSFAGMTAKKKHFNNYQYIRILKSLILLLR